MNTDAVSLSKRPLREEEVGADYTSLQHSWTDQLQKSKNRERVLIGTVGLLVVALVLFAVAVLYLALFRAPKPYVLKVDEANNVSLAGYLEDGFSITDEMIPSQIMRFVENWRTVTPDNTQQKRMATRLFCMVTDRAPARSELIEYFRTPSNDPFERNRNASVTTDIRQISKLSGSTWQVEWYETKRAHDGRVEGDRQTWRATMIVEPGKTQPVCLEGNPLGLYVQQLNWTQAR